MRLRWSVASSWAEAERGTAQYTMRPRKERNVGQRSGEVWDGAGARHAAAHGAQQRAVLGRGVGYVG